MTWYSVFTHTSAKRFSKIPCDTVHFYNSITANRLNEKCCILKKNNIQFLNKEHFVYEHGIFKTSNLLICALSCPKQEKLNPISLP